MSETDNSINNKIMALLVAVFLFIVGSINLFYDKETFIGIGLILTGVVILLYLFKS